MNTTNVTDKAERKDLKRKARAEAPPIGKRAEGVARGDNKKKVKKIVKGQRKREPPSSAHSDTRGGPSRPAIFCIRRQACLDCFALRASTH